MHPVVFGKDIGNFKIDLIARKAKARDSTKSPLTPYLSIGSIIKFCGIFFFILSIKILFFLPPPQTKTFLTLVVNEDKASPIIFAVKSVSVAVPSSRESPLAKETSKSFTSNDKEF